MLKMLLHSNILIFITENNYLLLAITIIFYPLVASIIHKIKTNVCLFKHFLYFCKKFDFQ